jgi:Raf kinase inhibitor-like YbhB/YbcL family protein
MDVRPEPPGGSLLIRRLGTLVVVALVLVACSGSSGGGSVTPEAATPTALPSTPTASQALPTETLTPSLTMPPTEPPTPAPLTLTSTAFAPNGPIPAEFTCHGADRSPALAWSGAPPGTQALTLFVDDPDGRDWVHWSVLDIDPATSGLPDGVPPGADSPQQGTNDFGNVGYGGPCPPSGTHHYQFTLYALAAPLGLPDHPRGTAVRAALAKASVLGKVTLVGTFAR